MSFDQECLNLVKGRCNDYSGETPRCFGCLIQPMSCLGYEMTAKWNEKLTQTLCKDDYRYVVHGILRSSLGHALLELSDDTYEMLKEIAPEVPLAEIPSFGKYWKLPTNSECNSCLLIQQLEGRALALSFQVYHGRIQPFTYRVYMYPLTGVLKLGDFNSEHKPEDRFKWILNEKCHRYFHMLERGRGLLQPPLPLPIDKKTDEKEKKPPSFWERLCGRK